MIRELLSTDNVDIEIDENKASKYFIYIKNNNIIGFINYYDLIDRFEIANIFVKEEFRNKKIGYKLLSYIIELGQKRNIINITLEVNINNVYAIKLYEKCNFKIISIRKKYYNGIDGYLMERKMM